MVSVRGILSDFSNAWNPENNEVWSYGEEAERILVKYLRLRYRLMPYIYSLAYQVTQTGAPLCVRFGWTFLMKKAL